MFKKAELRSVINKQNCIQQLMCLKKGKV
jgi:hypothetical protein